MMNWNLPTASFRNTGQVPFRYSSPLTQRWEKCPGSLRRPAPWYPQIDSMDDNIAQEVAAEGASGDEVRAATRGKRTAFRVGKANDWGEVILKEFQQLVAEGLQMAPGQRPSEGGTEWPPPEA